MHRPFLAFAVLLLVAGCKKPSPQTVDAAAPAPPIPDAAVVDAPVDASAPAAATLDDLLHETATTVTVSSRVDNPRDFPEHLADGKPDTAWNGKTGDLAGWIEIAVPAGVTATTIAITPGFDKGELFTQNHRIKKLALLRDGKPLREVTLDPERRTLQPIVLDAPAPGGTYRLVVRETVPGTKKAWKELVVSELAVLGHAGSAREPAHLPKVLVAPGSAPPPKIPAATHDPAAPAGWTAPSLAALCDRWKTAVAREVASGLAPGETASPECKDLPVVPPVDGLAPGWARYHALGLGWNNGWYTPARTYLLVERTDGSVVVGPVYGRTSDVGCFTTPDPIGVAFRVKGSDLLRSEAWLTPIYKDTGNEGPIEESGARLDHMLSTCAGPSFACTEPKVVQGHSRQLGEPAAVALRKTPPPAFF